MKWSSFRYLTKQGWHNMLANRMMTFASVGVLTACLVITGTAALLAANVNQYVNYLNAQNVVEVYLNDISEAATANLEQQLDALENVSKCEYISKEQAVTEMMNEMEEYSDLFQAYAGENNPNNPLPASLRLTVADVAFMQQTVQDVRNICGENIYDIQAPSALSEMLVTLKTVVTYVGWGLVGVLGLVSIVVISNTIRLTVFARRREISIMKYVGATNAFIRMPFFVEGMTVGALSGLLGSALVCSAYYALEYYIRQPQASWLAAFTQNLLPFHIVWPLVLVGFVVFGMFVGSVGCATSIRKHLKV